VAQACVVAQPHPKWDERPVALVVLKPGAEVSRETILEHCGKPSPSGSCPTTSCSSTRIPLTSTGKMDKKVVRADLEGKGYRLPDLRG
jgi:acyl-CoA synthetase (AMP-forming)/AMP-acid ligase II